MCWPGVGRVVVIPPRRTLAWSYPETPSPNLKPQVSVLPFTLTWVNVPSIHITMAKGDRDIQCSIPLSTPWKQVDCCRRWWTPTYGMISKQYFTAVLEHNVHGTIWSEADKVIKSIIILKNVSEKNPSETRHPAEYWQHLPNEYLTLLICISVTIEIERKLKSKWWGKDTYLESNNLLRSWEPQESRRYHHPCCHTFSHRLDPWRPKSLKFAVRKCSRDLKQRVGRLGFCSS